MLRLRLFTPLAALALVGAGCSSVFETLAPEGAAEARWGLDPTVRLADDATTLPLLVNEVGCASGMDATGRIFHEVGYFEDRVVITVRVAPPPGEAQDCQGNPNTPYQLELDEPLDGRMLVNGATDEVAMRPIEFVGDGPGPHDGPVEGLTIEWAGDVDERRNSLVVSLHARAQDPSELRDLHDLSLNPDGIELILGNSGHVTSVAVGDLHDPQAWTIEAPEGYEGFSGPFSILDTLKGRDRLLVTIGDHPHCAGPSRPAPAHLEDLVRIGITPTDADSCIDWFAVDLYLDDDGLVHAMVLDLFGP